MENDSSEKILDNVSKKIHLFKNKKIKNIFIESFIINCNFSLLSRNLLLAVSSLIKAIKERDIV